MRAPASRFPGLTRATSSPRRCQGEARLLRKRFGGGGGGPASATATQPCPSAGAARVRRRAAVGMPPALSCQPGDGRGPSAVAVCMRQMRTLTQRPAQRGRCSQAAWAAVSFTVRRPLGVACGWGIVSVPARARCGCADTLTCFLARRLLQHVGWTHAWPSARAALPAKAAQRRCLDACPLLCVHGLLSLRAACGGSSQANVLWLCQTSAASALPVSPCRPALLLPRSTTVFSHSQTVVLCGSCSTVLCTPTGGRARLTEGTCARKPGTGVHVAAAVLFDRRPDGSAAERSAG